MVESTLYFARGGTWKEFEPYKNRKQNKTYGKSQGDSVHAERQLWEALNNMRSENNVFLFVQDACPCSDPKYECFLYFRRLSETKYSFIFEISRNGYNVGDGVQYADPGQQAAAIAYYERGNDPVFTRSRGGLRSGAYAAPITLYMFHNEAYLGACPPGFPQFPPLLRF